MTVDRSRYASAAAVAAISLLAVGCQQTGTPAAGSDAAGAALRQGYTCCNLHYENDWISDGNYASLPMIPAGTPIKVLSYGRNRAQVEIGGKPMRLGHDYGRAQESTEQWVAKIVVQADPKTKIASYPAEVREAIQLGRVMPGMTKEQVLIAVGYPLTSETPSLDARVWRHWVTSFGEYQLNWGNDGRVEEIVADPTTKNLIVHQPKRR